jgi:hypothetical protein
MQAYLVYLIISLHMIQYTSQYQTKIDDFSSLHQLKLNPNNRWIQLSFILPWDNLVKNLFQESSTRVLELKPSVPGSLLGL